MTPEDLNDQIYQIEFGDLPESSVELDAVLQRLNALAPEVHHLPEGDMQAATAKIDELRRQYTEYYNVAVAGERSPESREPLGGPK